MKVIPVVVPNLLWNEFVSETVASLGRSPTRSLDEATLVVGDYRSFVMALGEFQQENTNPIPYLRSRQSDAALDMLSVSFLVEARAGDLYDILKLGHINTFEAEGPGGDEDVVILSGTLRQWRLLIFEAVSTKKFNVILIEVVKHFLHWGLRDLVADCDFSVERKALSDGRRR